MVEKITLNNKELLTVLYESAAGNHLPRNQWNANVLKELGRQIGKLHRLSRKLEARRGLPKWKSFKRNFLFCVLFMRTLSIQFALMLWDEEISEFYHPQRR